MSSKRKTTMCQEGVMIPGDTMCYPHGSKQAIVIGDRGATCQMAATKDCIKREDYIGHIKNVLQIKSNLLKEMAQNLIYKYTQKTENKKRKIEILKYPESEQQQVDEQ